MGDSLTTIIAIFLAAILMFIFPLAAIADRNDDTSQMYIQTILDEFVNTVSAKGRLTKDDYDRLEAKLLSTNNSYDIELTISVADVNPGKKTNNTQIGDTTYYSIYTTQILNALNSNKTYDILITNKRRKNPTQKINKQEDSGLSGTRTLDRPVMSRML